MIGVVGFVYFLFVFCLLVVFWWIVVFGSFLVMVLVLLVDWFVWFFYVVMFVFSKGILDCWVVGLVWCWCWWLFVRVVIDIMIGVVWWNCD